MKSQMTPDHAVYRMTAEARIATYGRTDECKAGDHDRCTTWRKGKHVSGYETYRFPCGCECHFQGGE